MSSKLRSRAVQIRRLEGTHRHSCLFCPAEWRCAQRHGSKTARVGKRCCASCREKNGEAIRRTIKVWIAAHVGSDGKVRPCPDNHPRPQPIRLFACRCGGGNPVLLTGTVRVSREKTSQMSIAEIQKAQATIAMGGAA